MTDNLNRNHLKDIYTLRPPALGTDGAVSSPHYLATQAGKKIIESGGHAVEAGIAMNAVLCVVYPHMAGLGGDLFSLVWDKREERVQALNGSGRSGKEASIKKYKDAGYDEIPNRGPLSSNTVPGTVAAWEDLYKHYGNLSWKELIEPAVDYAKEGFPISGKLAEFLNEHRELLDSYGETKSVIGSGKQPESVKEGQLLKQPELAHSLQLIASNGAQVFYEGELAEKICNDIERHGGLLTIDDFKQHNSEWEEPISANYRDITVYEMQPNTQGLASVILYNLLDEFSIPQMGDGSADYHHLMVEATRLAFMYRDRWVTDPEFIDAPIEDLTSKAFAKNIADRIKFENVSSFNDESFPFMNSNKDTTFMCAVDKEGNSCSLIQSIYHEFGSAYMPEGTGFIMQNRGSFFSLDKDHPNRLEPEKKTFHTLIPSMALKNGRPYMLFGTMGGEGQPQTKAALLTRVVDFNYNVQQAIEAPRWLYGRTWGEGASDSLKIETRIPSETIKALKERGHELEKLDEWSPQMGHAQAIVIDPESGVLAAGADPRGDGAGLSW